MGKLHCCKGCRRNIIQNDFSDKVKFLILWFVFTCAVCEKNSKCSLVTWIHQSPELLSCLTTQSPSAPLFQESHSCSMQCLETMTSPLARNGGEQ